MSNIQLFNFAGQNVEVIIFEGQPLFNPRHVGTCLGLDETTIRRHIQEMNQNQVKLLQDSNVQDMNVRKLANRGENFLTDSGVYKLIFKSRKPEAEAFQNWVTDEVLPEVRKKGFYATEITTEKIIENPDWFIGLLQKYKEERIARLANEKLAIELHKRNDDLKEKLDDSETWWTLLRFLAATGHPYRHEELSSIGKKASKLSRSLGLEIKKAKDNRWGKVNSYHIEVFKLLYPQYKEQIEEHRLK
jgi:prophage antirepressor-like protein